MRFPRLSPQTYRTVTVWALAALLMIIVTGGAVRLTGSGLGCSDWPTCEQDQIVAPLEFHALVEFVNRMFTGVVSIAVIAAVLGSLWRTPRRPDLTRWSWGLVAGVIAQIILGGLLVMSELDPRFTIGHFLLSMVLVWNAQILVHRAGRPDHAPDPARPARFAALATNSRTVVAAAAVVLVTGTVVTGAGPHGGDDGAARFAVDISVVARVHAICVIAFLALSLGLRYRIYRQPTPADGPHRVVNTSADRLIVAIVSQGAIGYAQYFSGVPPLLVGVHLLGAAIVWMAALQLHLDLMTGERTMVAEGHDGDARMGHAAERAPILSKS